MPNPMSRRFAVLPVALGLLAGCAHAPSLAASDPSSEPPTRVVVTGSRIPQRVDPETGRPQTVSLVRFYSSEDLARTGAPDVMRALRLLGPGGL
jgi:hypothetical protein